MSKLVLPRHIAEQRAKELNAAQADRRAGQMGSVANTIQGSSVNMLSSDDFVTRAQAAAQMQELADYIEARRDREPEYCLPRPIGWRVSVLMLTIPETTEGGLVIVDGNREARALASPQGIVLSLAPAAFRDPSRFTVEGKIHPWVSVGDRVLWKKYDVTMFQLGNGQRLGFMNDTQAFGVIDGGWDVPV